MGRPAWRVPQGRGYNACFFFTSHVLPRGAGLAEPSYSALLWRNALRDFHGVSEISFKYCSKDYKNTYLAFDQSPVFQTITRLEKVRDGGDAIAHTRDACAPLEHAAQPLFLIKVHSMS